MRDTREIQITLIHTDLLDIRSQRLQIINKKMAVLPVHLVVRRKNQEIWTLFQGGGHGLTGINAHLLRRNRLGKDDAVAALLIPSNNSRHLPQIRPRPRPQILNRSPA